MMGNTAGVWSAVHLHRPFMTIPFLQVWPGFDPLPSDARFEKLLERFTVS
jgi:hypothetical protein